MVGGLSNYNGDATGVIGGVHLGYNNNSTNGSLALRARSILRS